jgi:MFS family permease
MFQPLLAWIQKYERHLSAVAMVAGFVVDSIFFERIDLWQTHLVFASYTVICLVAIPLLHWLETRTSRGIVPPKWRSLLPIATQFALGGFWSGFVIFYWRSAVFGVSWPFLLFLFLVFIGNEYFSKYHEKLVFTSVLFFFALYSYAIFALPIYTGTIGTMTFILSGVIVIGVFAMFTSMLRLIGRESFTIDISRARIGALVVLVIINFSYFSNILPPLPLSAESVGIYHAVWRVPDAYLASDEINKKWYVRYLGFKPTLHVVYGESLYAYIAVFAPTSLTTTVRHHWELYDKAKKKWVTKSNISYQIVGGRDGGYRGYSAVPVSSAGKWRVSIKTVDGRIIARMSFKVKQAIIPPPVETIILK